MSESGQRSAVHFVGQTSGSQKVRGIMSFSRGNMFLLTVDPRIASMRDFKVGSATIHKLRPVGIA
jgi:hypothetical protein